MAEIEFVEEDVKMQGGIQVIEHEAISGIHDGHLPIFLEVQV